MFVISLKSRFPGVATGERLFYILSDTTHSLAAAGLFPFLVELSDNLAADWCKVNCRTFIPFFLYMFTMGKQTCYIKSVERQYIHTNEKRNKNGNDKQCIRGSKTNLQQ